MAKRGLTLPGAEPYAGIGFAFRRTSGSTASTGSTLNPQTGVRQSFSSTTPWAAELSYGLVVAGGVEFQVGRVRIAPEVRYTRWDRDVINAAGSQGYFVSSGLNQVQVLVGFSFH